MGEAEVEHPQIMPTGRQMQAKGTTLLRARRGRRGIPRRTQNEHLAGKKGEPREWQGISRFSVVSQIQLYRVTANKILPLRFPHLILEYSQNVFRLVLGPPFCR